MTLRVALDLALPDETVTSTLIVFGGKGMGKTNFGGVLVEEMSAARLRWCVLDPLGVWWGLRHTADGKGAGVECLILGGVHGDIPIEPTGGGIVADLVVDEDVDVIVDFSRRTSGQMWSKGERIRFVTDYATRLFQRQGELVGGHRRPPIFVVLDEAARYIPQAIRAGDKDMAACVGAWEDLVEEGRNVGIGVGLLTQRSARINKSVSELADALFAFRTVGPLSVAAIMDWLGEHVPKERIRELVERVRSLDVGSALVVSPGWLHFEDVVHVRARRTFDSSATPKAGDARRVVGAGAMPDLGKYQARMADTIERTKANDPAELRRRIAALERELDQRPTQARTETVERIVEVPVLGAEVGHLQSLLGDIQEVGTDQEQIGLRIFEVGRDLLAAIKRVATPPTARPDADPGPGQSEAPRQTLTRPVGYPDRPTPARSREPRANPEPGASGETPLGRAERSVLTVLAQYPAGRTQTQVAILAGYSRTSGGYFGTLASLRRRGYIEGTTEQLRVTDAGLDALGPFELLPTGSELLRYWTGRLAKAEANILATLADALPEALPQDEVAARTGYSGTSGGFFGALAKLRTLQLISGTKDALRAAEELR